jgi:hypothetical protein
MLPDPATREKVLASARDFLLRKLLEDIPKDWRAWHPSIKKALLLSESLFSAWNDALLFRTLATLRLDVPVFDTVEGLRWKGAHPNFEEYCQRMKSPDLFRRVTAATSMRSQHV